MEKTSIAFKKKNTLMVNPSMDNEDIVREIFSHLPLKSLLRFRAVSKFLRDVIDSPSFKTLHTQQLAKRNDATSLLLFSFVRERISDMSMTFLDTGKSCNDFPALQNFFDNDLNPGTRFTSSGREVAALGDHFIGIIGPVNGLMCIYHMKSIGPIAVCNPSLGQIYELPLSPTCTSSQNPNSINRDVGICFDHVAQDYKVVQLLSCNEHECLHVSLYSRRANEWRELPDDDLELHVECPIQSSCKEGSFSHWQGFRVVGGEKEYVIVSFDLKKEVFRTFEMPNYPLLKCLWRTKVFARGDSSFVLVSYHKGNLSDINGAKSPTWVRVYEPTFERDNILSWVCIAMFGPFSRKSQPSPKTLWNKNCVVMQQNNRELGFYDYWYDREFIERFEMDRKFGTLEIFGYKGSTISP